MSKNSTRLLHNTYGDGETPGFHIHEWTGTKKIALHIDAGDLLSDNSPCLTATFGGVSVAMTAALWRAIALKLLEMTEPGVVETDTKQPEAAIPG